MFRKIIRKIWRLIKLVSLAMLIVFITMLSKILIDIKNDEKAETIKEENIKKKTTESVFLVQPWQLNSRYKINNIVKFLKLDLDKDGKDELAAITNYDKLPNEVFYYAGFYRFNPVTDLWDEFYAEELNILNYGLTDTSKVENVVEYNQKIINIWSTEFTTLKNIGDVTGDGDPEIVFSSLIQGKYFDNYVIVAQSGKSHYRFKIFYDQNTMAEIMAEDGMLIEKYFDEKYSFKKIYEWSDQDLRFKLIETQKKIMDIPKEPTVSPELEVLTG